MIRCNGDFRHTWTFLVQCKTVIQIHSLSSSALVRLRELQVHRLRLIIFRAHSRLQRSRASASTTSNQIRIQFRLLLPNSLHIHFVQCIYNVFLKCTTHLFHEVLFMCKKITVVVSS